MPRAPEQRGFTLLEVLVAVALAGLFLAVALRGHAGSLALSVRAVDQLTLTRHAQALAAELLATAERPFETSGSNGDGTVWSARLAPVAEHVVARPGAGGRVERRRVVLLRLDVAVRPADRPAPVAEIASYTLLVGPPSDE